MNRMLRGYTLIELMVVILIVSLIAGVAIPAYESYVLKSRVENLKARLLETATAQERHFAARGRYATLMTELVPFGLTGAVTAQHLRTEGTTIYTGVRIDARAGMSYWVAGNTDLDKNVDTIEECWLYLSRNFSPQPAAAREGIVQLYDDRKNATISTLANINNNTVCAP